MIWKNTNTLNLNKIVCTHVLFYDLITKDSKIIHINYADDIILSNWTHWRPIIIDMSDIPQLNAKILILGHKHHGKDEVAKIISLNYGLDFVSSSMFCLHNVVFPALKDKFNYQNVQECLNDVENRRMEWRAAISNYNSPDKTRLSREILSNNDIYVGMRARDEFLASKHLFDLILWVDAGKRKGYNDDSLDIGIGKDMLIIDNNGRKDQIKKNIDQAIRCYLECL